MGREMDSSREIDELVGLLGTWSSGAGPLYRRLAGALRRAVEEGSLAAGDRLPSERTLAAALAVSRTTVVGAYDELRTQGLLDSRRGSGTRVSTRLAPARSDGWLPGGRGGPIYRTLIEGPQEVISVACMKTDGLPEVAQAVREVADHDLPALMAEDSYHPRGLPVLRAAIAERYERMGLPTAPDQVVVTTGAHQALALVSGLYLRKGSPMIVEDPGFAGCLDLMRAEGAVFHPVPLDDQGADPVRTRRIAAEHAPHLMYVMPSYHNPTGTLMSAARRRELGEISARYGVPILEDSAYTGIRAAHEPAPIAALAPRGAEIVTVDSLCKVGWAGLRLGWLRAPLEVAERLSRRKIQADLGSPLLDQAVAVRLLPRFEELARKRSEQLGAKMDRFEEGLRAALPDWHWRRPTGGSALWIRLPGVSARTYAQIALRHGVDLIPGTTMSANGDPRFEEYFRLPIAHGDDLVDELIWRLARAWRDLDRHGPCEAGPVRVVV